MRNHIANQTSVCCSDKEYMGLHVDLVARFAVTWGVWMPKEEIVARVSGVILFPGSCK